MVELKEKELVIRIDTDSPAEDLKDIQETILYVVSNMDNDFMNRDNIYPIFTFLSALLPSEDQLKKLKE